MTAVQFKTLSDDVEVKGMTVFNKGKVDPKKQPMFFGAPLGIQRYDSYKYPVFDKLTQTQLGYFWRPEEVSLQKDRADYQSLRPEQKHIFTSNLKYQILLDSVQGRGPGMAFIPYCSLPELEACMEVWGFMEMIHSRSYTYIIKNVYADPSEIFDTILDDQMILSRAESVTEAYNDFINEAQMYGSSNMWQHNLDGVPSAQYTLYELKRKLYRAVMNVNILEGIRFYVSFACSFAFGELKLMEGSAKIISLIARDENQHLVLTQNIINKWNQGDDPDMLQIAKEEEEWVKETFQKAVTEEKGPHSHQGRCSTGLQSLRVIDMKAKDIRDLSTEEIQTQIKEEKEQLTHLQFQHAIADLQNPMILRDKRRFIARLETILKERLMQEEAA